MEKNRMTSMKLRRLIAPASLLLLLGAGLHPIEAWAVDCAVVLAASDNGADSDKDGFTDHQECSGITTVGITPVTIASCRSTDGATLNREQCLDPDSRDLFVIFAPPTSAPSLLPQDFNAFGSVTAYGITFSGAKALGLAVHQLKRDEASLERVVTNAALETLTAQKAVKVTESLDVSGTVLGYCQWGSPMDLDGCTIFTQRTKNFIAETCGSAAIVTAGGAASDAENVLRAYSTWLMLHEAGHSLGGLTATYESRFGGYHYKAGSDLVMEQAVTYSVKAGKCKFYIPPDWNQTLDPPAVKLIN